MMFRPEQNEQMLKVVKCKRCRRREYYGTMYWDNGKQICRRCIHEIWHRKTPSWKPSETDYVFPLYEDGADYTSDTPEDTTSD